MHHLTELFESSPVLIVELEDGADRDRFWFRATEVCKTLGFSNTKESAKIHCKEHQVREFKVGMGRPALYVSMPGVFRLILRSKAPVATKFQDWLTEELLPKLITRGGVVLNHDRYMMTATAEEVEQMRQALADRDRLIEKQSHQIGLLGEAIQLLEPLTSERMDKYKKAKALKDQALPYGRVVEFQKGNEAEERSDMKRLKKNEDLTEMIDGVLWRKQLGKDEWDVDLETPSYSDYTLWRNFYPMAGLPKKQAIAAFNSLKASR